MMNAIEKSTVMKPTTIAGKKIAVKPTPIMKSPKIIASALDQPGILVLSYMLSANPLLRYPCMHHHQISRYFAY